MLGGRVMSEFQQFKVKAPSGVNFSREPSQLNPQLWDNAENVTFRHGKTFKCSGYEQGFGKAWCKPEVVLPLRDSTQTAFWWSYAGKKEITPTDKVPTKPEDYTHEEVIYRVENKNKHTPVYPTNPDGTSAIKPTNSIWGDVKWTGGELNGVPFLLKEKPYVWVDSSSKYQPMDKFPKWLSFKMMKPYRNYLIGLNYHTFSSEVDQENGFGPQVEGYYPGGVWWSNEIAGNSLQVGDSKSLWCDMDANRNSGWNILGGSGGPIVDGRSLRDSFIIYREASVWQMAYEGGINVFSFKELFDDDGALGTNCIQEVEGKHYVISSTDVYVHSGVSKQSICDGITRKAIFESIDPDYLQNVFLSVYGSEKELWVCIPEKKLDNPRYKGACNVAFVFNWVESTWSKRDIPNILDTSYAILNATDDTLDITWDAIEEGGPVNPDGAGVPTIGSTWEEATDTWLNSTVKYNSANWGLVMGSDITLYPHDIKNEWDDEYDWLDESEWDERDSIEQPEYYMFTSIKDPRYDTYNFEGVLEKRWMTMGDSTDTSFVSKVYPDVRGFEGSYGSAIVGVYIGGTMHLSEEPTYRYLGEFDASKQDKLSCRCSGNYIHLKLIIPEYSRAEIRGYTLEWTKIGRRS